MENRYVETVQRMDKLQWIRRILQRRVTEELSLHGGQLHVLEYIHRYPGCTQVEIAETLLISPSSIAQSTKRMQRDGLLEKRMTDDNQRCKRLSLTQKGEQVAQSCRKGFEEIDESLFEGITDEEIAVLESVVGRLLYKAASCASLDVENMDFFSFMKLKHQWHHSQEEKEKC